MVGYFQFEFEEWGEAGSLGGRIGLLAFPLRVRVPHGVCSLAEGNRLNIDFQIGAPLLVDARNRNRNKKRKQKQR